MLKLTATVLGGEFGVLREWKGQKYTSDKVSLFSSESNKVYFLVNSRESSLDPKDFPVGATVEISVSSANTENGITTVRGHVLRADK
jgi:hypothetical protein